MTSKYPLIQIIALLGLLFIAGCTSPKKVFYDQYAYPSASISNRLSKPYRYKTTHPVRRMPHRFVVFDQYTGREFGVILRGLKTNPKDPDVDKFTDMNLENSFSGKKLYLLQDSIIKLPNGDLKAIVYIAGQSMIDKNLVTGEKVVTPLFYHIPQFEALYNGEAVFDETDTTCPLYKPMQTAQMYAKADCKGFWSKEKKWRDTLKSWITFEENEKKRVAQRRLKTFQEKEVLVKDRKPNSPCKISMNLSQLIDHAHYGGFEKKANKTLREVIQKTTVPEEKAMAILSLLCVPQPTTKKFLTQLENDSNQTVRASIVYAKMLFEDELNINKAQQLPGTNVYVKKMAVKALTCKAGQKAIPVLIHLLKDDSYPVKTQILLSLGHLNDPSVVPYIIESMEQDYPRMYTTAIGVMEDFSGEIWSQNLKGVQQIIAWWKKHKNDPIYNSKPTS